MNSSLVSIIIPIYNSEIYLDKCIQSVINQSYKNIEIILVNDGSIDSSAEICNNYSSIDLRVKTIHKDNGGLVSARKAGLKVASGDYILYIDGDDWIELDLVEIYMNQVKKFNADVVIASHIVNLEDREDILVNTIPAGVYDKHKLNSIVYPKMLYTGKFSQFGIFSYIWGKLFKKEVLIENQLKVSENITIGEDALCLYPTLLDINTLVILEYSGYHYRQRTDSLIKTLRKIETEKMQEVYNNLKNIFLNKRVSDIMLTQLQYYILSLLIINTEGPDTLSNMNLYPFDNSYNVRDLVIYGGGTFGQHMYKKITNCKSHNIVSWIDEKYIHYSKLNLPVTGFDTIKQIKYDLVLIALIDENNSNRAYSKLLSLGVPSDKIVQIPYYKQTGNIQNLLLEYKIIL